MLTTATDHVTCPHCHKPITAVELMTYRDASDKAQVPERTVRGWVASGALAALQLGRHRRIRSDDWAAFLNTRRIQVPDPEAQQ